MKRIAPVPIITLLIGVVFTGCAPGAIPSSPWHKKAVASAKTERNSALADIYGKGAVELGENPALADYLVYAAANNPGLRAQYHKWRAALEKAPQVNAFPEPKLSYTQFIREIETRVGPQRAKIGLMQPFPKAGELAAREDVALKIAVIERHIFEIEKLKLFYAIKSAYYRHYYVTRSIAIVEENTELLKNIEAVVNARYTTGAAPVSALMAVQVELGKLEDRLKTLKARIPVFAAKLNAAIGRDASVPFVWPAGTPAEPEPLDEADIAAAIVENNPELAAAKARIGAAEAGGRLAKTAGRPNFGIGVTHFVTGRSEMHGVKNSGRDAFAVMLEVSLPLRGSKYDAAEREAKEKELAAMKALANTRNKLSAAGEEALFNYEDARRKLQLYRDSLIPKTEQTLGTATTAYSTGKGSYLEVFDAQRALLAFQLEAERALVDAAVSLAELEKIAGRQLRREQTGDSAEINEEDKN